MSGGSGAGSAVGAVVGGTAGFLVGGPVGAAVGAGIGAGAGGSYDANQAAKKQAKEMRNAMDSLNAQQAAQNQTPVMPTTDSQQIRNVKNLTALRMAQRSGRASTFLTEEKYGG